MAPTPLLTMVDDSGRRVRAFVAERDIARICPGEQAQISAEEVLSDQADGRIEDIGPMLIENPNEPGLARFLEIEISFLKNERRFFLGQTVGVKLLGCAS